MALYGGLDVSLEETSICVIDESGHKVWQGVSSSESAAIAERVMVHAPEAVKVGFETGPFCTWHWPE
jgi:transposase